MNLTKKLFVAFFITLTLVSISPSKVQAADGGAGWTLVAKEYGIDGLAWFAANRILKKITAQTVNWINNGFQGNPAYVQDPGQFFLDIGDSTASKFLSGSSLNQLCSPFKAQVRLALVKNYLDDTDANFSCSLSILKNNYDQFTQDFSVGGWDGWFEMTQNSQNNPYGSYLAAQNALNINLGNQQAKYQDQLRWGSGFLSFEKCPDGQTVTQADLDAETQAGNAYDLQPGDCWVEKVTVTPGSVIEDQLNLSLGSGLERIGAADEIDEIIGALLDQLINKALGSAGGLFGASKPDSSGRTFTTDLVNDTTDYPPDRNETDCTTEPDTVDENGYTIPGITTCTTVVTNNTDTPGLICSATDEDGSFTCNLEGDTNPISGGGGGGGSTGGFCDDSQNLYSGILWDAMVQVLNENPEVGDLPNIESGGRQNARTFLALVETKLIGMGYNATDDVLNGNNNPNTGDLIAVWSSSDTTMERYDAISGAAPTIREAIQTDFTGSIPLSCTESGGGNNCSCPTTTTGGTGGGGTLPPGGTGGATIPSAPVITSVSPTTVSPGQTTITINGTDLRSATNAVNVQFFDYYGARSTVAGTANAAGTQATAVVPSGLAGPSGYVRIDNGSGLISNSIALQISVPLNVTKAVPTSTWNATQTINGWWPRLSPDGRYVAYGDFPESWVTDLQTGATYDFRNPADLAGIDHSCIAGQWITPTKLTIICDSTDLARDNTYRYEVDFSGATPGLPIRTSDNTGLVAGSQFVAKGGQWASWIANASMRLAKNNQVVATGVGGAMDISGDQIVHACDTGNSSLCLRTGVTVTRTFAPKTPLFESTITDGYIVYGGYGGVRGITPSGTDINLRLSTSFSEGGGKAAGRRNGSSAQVINVNGSYWVATAAWGSGGNFIFLRPWGSMTTIVIDAAAASLDIVPVGTNFVVAYNNDKGAITVITIPMSSPRVSIP